MDNINVNLNGVAFEIAIKRRFSVCEKSYMDEFKETINKLSSDLSCFENKSHSHSVAKEDLIESIGTENETLIAMSNCLHNSVVNGLYASAKRRIWRRKIKLTNNRYEKRN